MKTSSRNISRTSPDDCFQHCHNVPKKERDSLLEPTRHEKTSSKAIMIRCKLKNQYNQGQKL